MSIQTLDAKTTADQVIRALMARQAHAILKMPRYTPQKWWEADLWLVSAAGYASEYEVKMSRSDFLADAKKDAHIHNTGRWEPDPARPGSQRWVCEKEQKHALLAQADRGPSYFWFVAPMGMLREIEVPAWAGLMEFSERATGRPPWNLTFHTVRPAPRRHRTKVDVAHRHDIYRTAYGRWHAGAKP